jgi:hypothetical protein
MPGGKGKSVGGKGAPKDAAGKTQKSHSAKAGLQVSILTAPGYAILITSLPSRPIEPERVIGLMSMAFKSQTRLV